MLCSCIEPWVEQCRPTEEKGNCSLGGSERQDALTGEEHDEGALYGVAPELGGAAEESCQPAGQHAKHDRQRPVRHIPAGVAAALHRQIYEQCVARDRNRVVKAGRSHHRRGDRCTKSTAAPSQHVSL